MSNVCCEAKCGWFLLTLLMHLTTTSNAVKDENVVAQQEPSSEPIGGGKNKNISEMSTTHRLTSIPSPVVQSKHGDERQPRLCIFIGLLVAVFIFVTAYFLYKQSQKNEQVNTPNNPTLDDSTSSAPIQGPTQPPKSDSVVLKNPCTDVNAGIHVKPPENLPTASSISGTTRDEQSTVGTTHEESESDKVKAIGDGGYSETICELDPPERLQGNSNVQVESSIALPIGGGPVRESEMERIMKLDRAEEVLLHLETIVPTPINVMQLAVHFRISLVNRENLHRNFQKDPNSDIRIYLIEVLRTIRRTKNGFTVEMLIEYWKSNNMRPLGLHLADRMEC